MSYSFKLFSMQFSAVIDMIKYWQHTILTWIDHFQELELQNDSGKWGFVPSLFSKVATEALLWVSLLTILENLISYFEYNFYGSNATDHMNDAMLQD